MTRAAQIAALPLLALGLLLAIAPAARAQEMEQAQSAPSFRLLGERLGLDYSNLDKITAAQSETALAAGRQVVCLCGTCPKRQISECDCGWAANMRRTLAAGVMKGMTADELVMAYRKTYGDQGLWLLPDDGLAQVAWRLPYALAVLGLVMVFFVGFRYMRRQPGDVPGAGSSAGGGPTVRDGRGGDEEARKVLARELEEMD